MIFYEISHIVTKFTSFNCLQEKSACRWDDTIKLMIMRRYCAHPLTPILPIVIPSIDAMPKIYGENTNAHKFQ